MVPLVWEPAISAILDEQAQLYSKSESLQVFVKLAEAVIMSWP